MALSASNPTGPETQFGSTQNSLASLGKASNEAAGAGMKGAATASAGANKLGFPSTKAPIAINAAALSKVQGQAQTGEAKAHKEPSAVIEKYLQTREEVNNRDKPRREVDSPQKTSSGPAPS